MLCGELSGERLVAMSMLRKQIAATIFFYEKIKGTDSILLSTKFNENIAIQQYLMATIVVALTKVRFRLCGVGLFSSVPIASAICFDDGSLVRVPKYLLISYI